MIFFIRTSPTRHQLISGIGIPLNLENEAITLGLLMKAQYFLPENANQLKWIYFPDIFGKFTTVRQVLSLIIFYIKGNYTPTNYAETQSQTFPNGRRRREIVIDELTGQKYERYVAEVKEVGNEKLEASDESDKEYDDETFDDEFPEDEKLSTLQEFSKPAEEELMDASATRWLMYDGLGKLLVSKGLDGRPCVLRAICEAAETEFTYHSGLFGEIFHIIFT